MLVRFAPLAAGKWRVAFAPHITKLSALALARFDPIYYALDGKGGIESNVQYTWLGGVRGALYYLLAGELYLLWAGYRRGRSYAYCRSYTDSTAGWLSTRGSYGSRDEDEVSFVEWDSAWWDPGADRPSRCVCKESNGRGQS